MDWLDRSNNGSLEVASLVSDEPLVLKREPDPWGPGETSVDCSDQGTPDKEKEEGSSLWGMIFSKDLDEGRRSGKRAWTMVMISDEETTRKRPTSLVCVGAVMDL